MNNAVKLGAGVAGGYLLGRTRKLKLAVGLGAWLIGRRVTLSPSQLALQGVDRLRQTPEFGELTDRLRTEVGGAGKRALVAATTSRADALADRLRERNDALSGSRGDDFDDEEPRDEDDEFDDDEEPRDEDDEFDDEDDAYPEELRRKDGRRTEASSTRRSASAPRR